MRKLADVQKDITLARSNQDPIAAAKLYSEMRKLIQHDRDEHEDQNYFVMIDCPEHITHKVKLFTYQHRYAGVWECGDISDSCPHYDTGPEMIEDSEGRDVQIRVCAKCGVAVEDE